MKFRLQNIPREGEDVEFKLDLAALNARILAADGENPPTPSFQFSDAPKVSLRLEVETRLVNISGRTTGTFQTQCARCADDVEREFDIPVKIILKPHSERARPDEEVEDLQLGFYDGMEFDCEPIAQEALILGLPYSVLCKSDCKGLCPVCGKNLNRESCDCTIDEPDGDDRFSILKQLKVH